MDAEQHRPREYRRAPDGRVVYVPCGSPVKAGWSVVVDVPAPVPAFDDAWPEVTEAE